MISAAHLSRDAKRQHNLIVLPPFSSSFPKSNSRDDQRQAHLLRSDGVENFRAVSSGDAIEALEAAGLPITTSI